MHGHGKEAGVETVGSKDAAHGGLQVGDVSALRRQLEAISEKNKKLRMATIALAVLVLVLLGWLWNYFVLSYAVIENVELKQHTTDKRRAEFHFTVTSSGYLKYGYDDAVLEEKLPAGMNKQFSWQWGAGPAAKEFTVYVRSRWSVLPTWQTKTFQLQPG
jgi:hypothetical protein